MIILIGSLLFFHFYGMGNHQRANTVEPSKSEKELFVQLKEKYHFTDIYKIEVIPSDRITRILRGNHPFRHKLKIYTDSLNGSFQNDDSLKAVSLTIAERFRQRLSSSSSPFIEIEIVNRSKSDFDSVKYFYFPNADFQKGK